jgi:hypothetical protein
LYKALKDVGLEKFSREDLASLTRFIGKEFPTFGQLEAEGIITAEMDVWQEVPLFHTRAGVVSLIQLRRLLEQEKEVEFWYLPASWHLAIDGSRSRSGHYHYTFSRIWAATLAQLKLNLQLRVKGKVLEGFLLCWGKHVKFWPDKSTSLRLLFCRTRTMSLWCGIAE